MRFIKNLSILSIVVLMLSSLLNVSGFAIEVSAETNILPPQNLKVPALASDENSITLVWEKPADYENIVDYNVYMDGKKIGSANNQAISPAKSHIDKFYADPNNSGHVKVVMHNFTATDLKPKTNYHFTVRAVDRNGNESMESNSVSQSTTAVPKVFNIKDYGAIGDGKTLNTEAIQRAIDEVTPGGKVLIPNGVFKTGAIWLKSDMTLEVAEGATLLGSENADDYPYHYLLYDYSTDERFYSLINAHTYDYGSLSNIRIVGKGTIDGNGWKQNGTDPDGFPLSQTSSSTTVYENGILAKVQVERAEELGSEKPYPTRSNLITLRGVNNVYYSGFTALNPSNHTLVNLNSNNVTVNGVKLLTYDVNNADGIEFAHGDGLTVFNNVFDTGDDAMNFAAGLGASSEHEDSTKNAWIFNNYFREGHGAVVTGSHTGAWIENILAEDNVLYKTEIGLRCKTNPDNGGGARNIVFRDNAMKDIAKEGFIFTSAYSDANAAIEVEPAAVKGQFKDIVVKNISVDGTGKEAIKVEGVSDQFHENIHFENVLFMNAKATKINYLKDSSFTNVKFNNTKNPWAITNSTGLTFEGDTTATPVSIDASSAPVWSNESKLEVVNTDDVSVTLKWAGAQDATGVKSYNIYDGETLVATVNGSAQTFKITGLSPALTYKFKVEAADATGNWTKNGPSLQVKTTGSKDAIAPAAPIGDNILSLGTVSGSLGTSWAKINWLPGADQYGIQRYEIYVNNQLAGAADGNVNAYTVTGLKPDTSYVIKIKAVDAAGNGTMYDTALQLTTKAVYDTGAPKWPAKSEAKALAITQTSVKLSWTAANDDKAVIGYRIYQNGKPLEEKVKFTPINTEKSVTGPSYRVEGLEPNTTYTFKIEAGDAAGKWTGTGPSLTITTKGPQNDKKK
ncbi:fibronectin type III domain-containing protein [Neobacillus sp. NPDC058068]|uniref:fibronectin type III domain-containing protein n=1 Tax=Neobacillus sp. NPDC058068 TaxID=3346325 RepID=UPI0036D86F02